MAMKICLLTVFPNVSADCSKIFLTEICSYHELDGKITNLSSLGALMTVALLHNFSWSWVYICERKKHGSSDPFVPEKNRHGSTTLNETNFENTSRIYSLTFSPKNFPVVFYLCYFIELHINYMHSFFKIVLRLVFFNFSCFRNF
jgi:hypothetical protein